VVDKDRFDTFMKTFEADGLGRATTTPAAVS